MIQSPFLQSIRDHLAMRRYSKRTIKSYLYWVKYFILFHGKTHLKDLRQYKVEMFLAHLAVDRKVSSSTQAIALNTLAYLYNNYLQTPLGNLGEFRRAERQPRLPVVLTQEEVQRLLSVLSGNHLLMASILYGSGLRRIELVGLRVKDIVLDHQQIQVWNGKGAKHRLVTLAQELGDTLKLQIAKVKQFLDEDLIVESYGGVWMPDALARKYPSAQKSLGWQYLFPATRLSFEPGTQILRRHHFDESNVNKFLRVARAKARLTVVLNCAVAGKRRLDERDQSQKWKGLFQNCNPKKTSPGKVPGFEMTDCFQVTGRFRTKPAHSPSSCAPGLLHCNHR